MTIRILCLAAGMILVGVSQAQAKIIDMGIISRSDVKSACERAGAQPFGIANLNGNYGCVGRFADVSCTVDHVCRAVVNDTRPMTGNSLDYVLTYGRSTPAATMIQPLDLRVGPVKSSQP
jgi:hypothetical protein